MRRFIPSTTSSDLFGRAATLLLLSLLITTATDAQSERASLATVGSFVRTYCTDCHNEADAAGDLDLESFDANDGATPKVDWDTATWEKMVRRLRGRQMPPADAERPDEAEYEATITAMESALDHAAELFPRPGRTDSIRRLTRSEYKNVIRDLLKVDVDVDSLLPAEESSHGFDNVTVGELSPTLLNRYITATPKDQPYRGGRRATQSWRNDLSTATRSNTRFAR